MRRVTTFLQPTLLQAGGGGCLPQGGGAVATHIINPLCRRTTAQAVSCIYDNENDSSAMSVPARGRCPMSAAATALPTRAREPHEIPGPRSLPFLGTLYKFLPFCGYSFKSLTKNDHLRYKTFGKLVREETLPGKVQYYVYDPDLIQSVFSQEGKTPVRFPLPSMLEYRKMRGRIPGLVGHGEHWLKCRKALNRIMLRPATAASFLPQQAAISEELISLMKHDLDENGELNDCLSYVYKWSLECIVVVLFAERLGALSANLSPTSEPVKLIEAIHAAFDNLHMTTIFWPFHKRKKTKAWKTMTKSLDYIWDIGVKYTNKHLYRLLKGEVDINSVVMQILSRPGLEIEEAILLLLDLLFAGVDNTATFTTHVLYNLAINPEKQRILQEEIDRVAPRGSEITSDTMEQLKYLKACIRESFRMASTPGTARILDKDITLDGYRIPAKNLILINQSVACKQEEYFKNPTEFRPERWLRENKDSHPFLGMHFGFGPRMCIGKRFAEQEMQLGILKMMQHFDIEYHHEPITFNMTFVMTPNRPVKLRLKPRA